jgi:hypothetical protein
MTTIAIDQKYIDVLTSFGDANEMIEEVVRRYTLKRIRERISFLQSEIAAFEAKYGLPYEGFLERIGTDEAFSAHIHKMHPTWVLDLNRWEFDVYDLPLWLGRLKSISNS